MIALRLLSLAVALLVTFTLPSACAAADAVKVTAGVDRTEIQIADPLELNVEVTAPHGSSIKFPEFDGLLGVFEILDVNDGPVNQKNDSSPSAAWTRTFLLETLEPGSLEIPSIEVSVTQPNEASKIFRTDPIEISVTSVVEANADLTKFNDIAGLIDVEDQEPPTNYFAWGIFAAAVALLAAAVGVWGWKTRSMPNESAKVWALGQLDSAGNDFNQAEGVLRCFLEEKFHVPAESLDRVTLATELKDRKVDQAMVASVEEILATSERVKFGGFLLSDQQKSVWLNQTRALISQLDGEEVV